MIERQIIIGLITSTDFLTEIESEWNPNYIEGQAGVLLSRWCWEYFKEYKRAPMRDIENIFIVKLKKGIDKDLAEEIEEDILPSLNDEYDSITSSEYLLRETRAFFKQRQIQLHIDAVNYHLDKGETEKAVAAVEEFKIVQKIESSGTDLSDPATLEKVRKALNQTYQNVVSFPGALGDFWNDQLVRGGLVSFLAPEKRGKTFWLLEFMMRAYRQKKKVAFFQAGDMSEAQQLVRIGVYLAKRSNKEKFIGTRYIAQQDCIKNQKDTCNKRVRECSFGLFGEEMDTREKITAEDLLEALESNPDYKPCFNCKEWERSRWGTPWLEKHMIKNVLSDTEAIRLWERFFIKAGRSVKISTHANLTLKVKDIENILGGWEKNDGFIPDLILIDYADILDHEIRGDIREKENHKWMRLRALSQRPTEPLVVVPTQADTDSYMQDILNMKNFSETKTKNAHVTAMYGLNQDQEGREKEIGIMRINKIVVREDDFHHSQQVHVLQHLAIGRPFLGSYY